MSALRVGKRDAPRESLGSPQHFPSLWGYLTGAFETRPRCISENKKTTNCSFWGMILQELLTLFATPSESEVSFSVG
jgi:hypothetical protein